MKRTRFASILVCLLPFIVFGQAKEIRKDLHAYLEEYNVEGSFSLYDLTRDTYILSSEPLFDAEYIPASTFKICNSLIGLETGVITDEKFVIPWDGVERSIPSWNADQDLQTAYKNSTVPYYQELARRVGGSRMYEWLNKVRYGNMDTSGGIDLFWLNGGMRVAPRQQLEFLKNLHSENLPFSNRTMNIVKKIMIEEETPSYQLRSKTGWGEQEGTSVGWYVGYVITKQKDVYFFATCIQSTNPDDQFARNRKLITRRILKHLHIL